MHTQSVHRTTTSRTRGNIYTILPLKPSDEEPPAKKQAMQDDRQLEFSRFFNGGQKIFVGPPLLKTDAILRKTDRALELPPPTTGSQSQLERWTKDPCGTTSKDRPNIEQDRQGLGASTAQQVISKLEHSPCNSSYRQPETPPTRATKRPLSGEHIVPWKEDVPRLADPVIRFGRLCKNKLVSQACQTPRGRSWLRWALSNVQQIDGLVRNAIVEQLEAYDALNSRSC
jgi:hypothetical protein